MTTFTYDRILDDVKTIEDLHLVSSEIDLLLESLYKSDVMAFKDTLNTKLHRNLTDTLTRTLHEQNVSPDDREQLEQYFTSLKAYMMHLPLLHLTLAYHPTNQQILALAEWIRQTTNKPVVLQLHYNQNVLGGAIINYEGKYVDLTLKKRLEGVYEAKKSEVLALLH